MVLGITASLALAACGAGGGSTSSEDENQITQVIEAATGSANSASCTTRVTLRYLEQTQFSTGEDAVTACEQDAASSAFDSDEIEVAVSDINVTDETATAHAAFTGGPADGQTLALSLVEVGGDWKIDHIDDFVEFDQPAFARTFVVTNGEKGEAPQAVLDCIEAELVAADPEEVQSAFLSGERDRLLDLIGACVGE